MGPAVLSKIHAGDCSKFHTERLQEDGEDVGHQNNEKKLETVRSTSSNIGSIISWWMSALVTYAVHKFCLLTWIDVGNGHHEAWPNELGIFVKYILDFQQRLGED